jgi:hypothetical protein
MLSADEIRRRDEENMKSKESGPVRSALFMAATAALLACGDDGQGLGGPAAERDSGRTPAAAARPQPREREPMGEDPAAVEQRTRLIQQRRRERFAGISLTEEQQQRLDALDGERESWQAESQEALRGLLDELAEARRAGDSVALKDSRARMRALRKTMPTLQGFVAELSDEQRAQLEQSQQPLQSQRSKGLGLLPAKFKPDSNALEKRRQMLVQRRQERFSEIGLSDDQQRRIEGLDDARRAWHEENQDEMHAIRQQMRAAQRSGEGAAATAARDRLHELRATSPGLASILAELSDEQRALIRARRSAPLEPPKESEAAANELGGVVVDGLDASGRDGGP